MAQQDPSSLVIGIYGPWGDGKTSVLNLVAEELSSQEQSIVVRFNPWQLGNEEALFQGFFELMADALGAKLTDKKEQVGGWLRDYGAVLKPIPIVGGAAGDLAKSAGQRMSAVELATLRQRIEGALGQAGKRVVVLMDDIDRLDKREIQTIFRLVKVAADFKHTAYVLAFDEDVVSDALGERYASGTEHGSNFLEKIVQLPLHLPPVGRQQLRQLTLETADKALAQSAVSLTAQDVSRFTTVFERSVMPRLRTPRLGKRYGNALLFGVPMIAQETDVVDLMLVEAMRVFYPDLYTWVRAHKREVTTAHPESQSEQAKVTLREALDHATKDMRPEEVQGARQLLTELFPRTESAWATTHYAGEWDKTWARQRRIASTSHFDRYFTYAVPTGDVSEVRLEEALVVIGDSTVSSEEALRVFRELVVRGPGVFLQRLEAQLDSLGPATAARVVQLFSMTGELFGDPPGALVWTDLERVGYLVFRLSERCSSVERRETLLRFVADADPVAVAIVAFRWLQPSEDDSASQAGAVEIAQVVGAALATRIAELWRAGAHPTTFGRQALASLHVWSEYGDPAELRAVLGDRVVADSNFVAEMLLVASSSSWSLDTGQRMDAQLRREGYDSLARYLDADRVMAQLREEYGDDVGSGDYYREMPTEERRVAHQFAHIHIAVNAEQTPEAVSPDGEVNSDKGEDTDA